MIVGFFILTVVASLINYKDHLEVYLIYWTHLNAVMSLIASLMSAIVVTMFYFGRFKVENSMPFVLKMYWALWNQTTVFAFLITFTYWSVLFDHQGNQGDLHDYLVHAFNSVIPLIDTWIVSHPPRYAHFMYVTIAGIDYGIFTIIYQLAGGVNR